MTNLKLLLYLGLSTLASNIMFVGTELQTWQEGMTGNTKSISKGHGKMLLTPSSTVEINCYYCNLFYHYGPDYHHYPQTQEDDKCMKDQVCVGKKCASGQACDLCVSPNKCKKITCSTPYNCESQLGRKGYGCQKGKCEENKCNKTSDCDSFNGWKGFGCKDGNCSENKCTSPSDCNKLSFKGWECPKGKCVENKCSTPANCDSLGYSGFGCRSGKCAENKCSKPNDCDSFISWKGFGCKNNKCEENKCTNPSDCNNLSFKGWECPKGKCVENKCINPYTCDTLGYNNFGCGNGKCVENKCSKPSECDALEFRGYACSEFSWKCERNGCNRQGGICATNSHCCWESSSCVPDSQFTKEGRCDTCLQVGEPVYWPDRVCRNNSDCCGSGRCSLDPGEPSTFRACVLPPAVCLKSGEGCSWSKTSCCDGFSCKPQTGLSPTRYTCEPAFRSPAYYNYGVLK